MNKLPRHNGKVTLAKLRDRKFAIERLMQKMDRKFEPERQYMSRGWGYGTMAALQEMEKEVRRLERAINRKVDEKEY